MHRKPKRSCPRRSQQTRDRYSQVTCLMYGPAAHCRPLPPAQRLALGSLLCHPEPSCSSHLPDSSAPRTVPTLGDQTRSDASQAIWSWPLGTGTRRRRRVLHLLDRRISAQGPALLLGLRRALEHPRGHANQLHNQCPYYPGPMVPCGRRLAGRRDTDLLPGRRGPGLDRGRRPL